jgi:RTX calcium-binding nonapeptide repeat (4 copies)
MRAAFRCALLVSAILLIQVPVAAANTAVTLFGNGNLDVQANATGSNITIAMNGATTITVSDPSGNVTGAGPNCTPAGPAVTVTCQNVTGEVGVAGKDGDDTIAVAPGTTVRVHLFGNNGSDTLTGGNANDDMGGGSGNDTLNGGPGNDLLQPGFGSDVVNGGAGNDRIEQQSTSGDADVLNSDGDDDFIWSQGNGDAQFNGGQGDDILEHSNFELPVNLVMSGGDGEDEVALNGSFDVGLAVSLDDQANDGALPAGTSNVHSDVETINTGGGPDVIVGSPGPNLIRSDVSRDSWFVLDAPGGNDTIDPGGGVDYVFSGGGDDNITATDQVGETINCGSNKSSPSDSDTATGDSIDTFVHCENVNAIPLPVLDTTDPTVTVKAPASISRRAFARRGLVVRLSADEPASFAVDLNAKVKRRGGALVFPAAVGEATLGTKRMRLGTGTRSLRLKPSKRFAASVRNRRLRLVVRVTAKDAAGNVTLSSRSVRVK